MQKADEGCTTDQIMDWVRSQPKISAYALSPMNEVFDFHVSDGSTLVQLVFKVMNDHAYPITDTDLKQQVAKTKRLNFDEQTFKCKGTMEWSFGTPEDVLSEKFKTPIVYVDAKDLAPLAAKVMEKTGFMLAMKAGPRGGYIEMLEHPVTKQVVICAPDFHARKAVCDDIRKQFDLVEFRFDNQSWSRLTTDFVSLTVGKWAPSVYSQDYQHILETSQLSPWVAVLAEVSKHDVLTAINDAPLNLILLC